MSVDPELWQIPAFEESMKASDKVSLCACYELKDVAICGVEPALL